MTVDLQKLAATGVAVELKPGKRYLIFVDTEALNVESLRHVGEIMPDVECIVIPLALDGGSVADAVAAFELKGNDA